MKRLLLGILFSIGLLSADPARAQVVTPQNGVQVTQGGNTAVVTASGALDVNLLQAAGSSLSVTGSSLNVNCTGGCASSTLADNAAFTDGTTQVQPIAGEYNTSIGNLTTGHAGTVQLTIDRMMYVNVGKVGGSALALGQTTMASSLPVVIASNQSNVPSNIAQVGGTALALGQTTMSASLPVTMASNQANVNVAVNAALPAGSAVVGETNNNDGCGTTVFKAAWQALPTSATAAASAATCVEYMAFSNTSSTTAYTLTVTDNQGSPVTVIPTTTLSPLQTTVYQFGGLYFTAGIKWNASNAAITGAILGHQ